MRPLSGPNPCTASIPADRSSPHARAVVGLGDAAPREEGSDVGGQAVPRPTPPPPPVVLVLVVVV